ncbi:MAG: glutamate--tRNA ligase [Patescibacteria group bacterium]
MLTQSELRDLAELLYPDTTETPADLEAKYPPRDLPESAIVTRFAPSPTGYVHIGGIYASLISKLLAEQSDGVFFLRIEDTDQARKVAGGTEAIIAALQNFQVAPTEGFVSAEKQQGDYGPYLQSERIKIYAVFAKWMVAHGLAYPCFCSREELEQNVQEQEAAGLLKKGYYGKWAKHRDLSLDEIKQQLAQGNEFVLRIRAPQESRKIRIKDLVRGKLEFENNVFDMVLIKSNGLPTYHFAHVIDDHLMRTTHISRGEEWLSSLPLHLQLFEMLEIPQPTYMHFSHIGKKEGDSVRKLSKRQDPEATVGSYVEQGYYPVAVLEYLLNLANSNFSDWRRNNPDKPYTEFLFDPRKIGKTIALFDLKKLEHISRDVVSKLKAEDVYQAVLAWARQFSPAFATYLETYPEYSVGIFNIERNQPQPRKDIVTWSDVPELFGYFYDELFAKSDGTAAYEKLIVSPEDAIVALRKSIDTYDPADSQEAWFEKHQLVAEQLGYARDLKSFKAEPDSFKGHIGHVMAAFRVALTHQLNTPDLHQLMQVMGRERVVERLWGAIGYFEAKAE